MVVNSINFFLFFLVVFFVYYFILKEKTKLQNYLLLIASYFFYGLANWKTLPILFISTIITYYLAIGIEKYNEKDEKKASILTTVGVCFGVGLLLYFKYLNFFIDSFIQLFNIIGLHCNKIIFSIILPIGISFFTFKLISYLLEVHRRKMGSVRDFVAFATYVSFFPTILSGPIDRPNKFIPQLKAKRAFNFDLAINGCNQIAWGMFMKMCIADRIAIYNDAVFNNISHHNGFTVLVATLLYPIQMYTDFAGYSDMAIGVGKLLGFNVALNFNYPFFGRNIAEYWRNWHISLTGWLTDYVFMPLNIKFRNIGKWGPELAILITFVLIGMWHKASWTFALFGLYHGLLYIPLMLSGKFFKKKTLVLNKWRMPHIDDIRKMLQTYLLVAIGLIIFRSSSLNDILININALFSRWGGLFVDYVTIGFIAIGLVILFIHDTHKAFNSFPALSKIPLVVSTSFYIIMIILIGVFGGDQFIYFQF